MEEAGRPGCRRAGARGTGYWEHRDLRACGHDGRGGSGNGGAGNTPSYKDARRSRARGIRENRAWGHLEHRTQRDMSIPSNRAGHTSGQPAQPRRGHRARLGTGWESGHGPWEQGFALHHKGQNTHSPLLQHCPNPAPASRPPPSPFLPGPPSVPGPAQPLRGRR